MKKHYIIPVSEDILIAFEDALANPSIHSPGTPIDDTGEEQDWGDF